ncbi:MAG TPA: tocopherol cyclase family protein, partial [Anaerolineae bacterium]|nr:tocopherol cyclase family protein [Anaerolineae bacterium]
AAERHVHAVIPGVFLGKDAATSHCFVQVLDGATGHSTYHRYPLDRFWASEYELDLRVGPNRFYLDRIQLDIDDADRLLRGELHFDGVTPWPVTLTSPGIMGPYSFAPFMECYHGVLGFDHAVRGALMMNGATINFDDGRGYIEKDWGQAFPRAWVWAQSNHFDQRGTSVTISVATIPWLRTSFRGFIIGLWHDRVLYRFATYTGATISQLRLTDTHVVLRVEDKRHRLEIEATRSEGGLLHAPYRTDMLQRVTESLTATAAVKLIDRSDGSLIFEGTGRHAGLEINGEIQQIMDE